MAQQLQATLETILEKVAILEARFDKLLTQSLCQLSDTAHAKEGEINVELTRRAETVAQAVLSLDKKIGSLEQIYPIYSPCSGQGVGVQAGGIQAQQVAGGDVEEEVEVEEMVMVSSAQQQRAAAPGQKGAQGEEVTASGFPKLEKTKEKLLKEIKRVVSGPNGERKVITYSQEEAAKLAAAGEELIGEELTEEEAELFYQEMLAEAEAEMCALESSIDTYSELSIMENPPDNLVSFASEAAEFLEKLMSKVTGIASEVVRPPPKFAVSDDEYLKLMELRVAEERREREEQRARDKKNRRVGFGTSVSVLEFEGEGGDDDFGSEYGSEFSDSSDGSSMFSESMSSEVPEGWEWSEEHQDYIYVGEDASQFSMEGEEGGKKGTYVFVEGKDGAEGQYYFVPEGAGGPEFNKELAVPSALKDKGKGQIPAGATAMTAEQMAGKMPPGKPTSFLAMQGDKMRKKGSSDGRDPAAFGGLGGGGKKLQFKKKKKKTDDDEDEGQKIEAPSGASDGAGGWESEMNKKKNKAKRKKSREDERRKSMEGSGGATYDTVKPKLLDKVPWEQPPPGVRPPAPVKNHDVPLPKDSKVLGVRPAIEWILKQPGPFCTTRMVYRNSKKTTRPLYIEKAFEDLHNYTLQGLVVGMLFTVKGNTLSNTKCFMKCAPAFVSKRYLREFGIDIEEYRESFMRVDDHASRDPYWFDLVDRVKEVHPWIDDFPVDVAYGNVAGMTREEMMAALKKRHAEFLEVYEAERLAIKAQLDAKSDVRVDETGKIIVKRKFKGTAPGLPHMPKHSWAED